MDPIKNDHKKPFSSRPTLPPADLTEKILSRIIARERRILQFKLGVSAAVFLSSLSAIILSYRDLVSGLSHSGFFQLASLGFSDFSAMMANFPDFTLSMVESIPVFTAAVLLTGVLLAIWSMAVLVDEASILRGNKFLSMS